MRKKYLMHVISGGHWDREWRWTAAQSKLKLIELIDNALDILESKPSYKCFCLDGGTIVLEDYFSVRSENKERFIKLVEEGRLDFVGWYTLPETFTVAAESLIRNLLIGKKIAAMYGGAMKSGYTATSYGQISQLPQIFQGFGIETAIFYRGTNKFQLPPFFRWEGKDGSKIYVRRGTDEMTRANWLFCVYYLMVLNKIGLDFTYRFNPEDQPVHLCDKEGYERQFHLLNEDNSFNKDKSIIKRALKAIKEQEISYAVGRHLLGMHFDDNGKPYEFTPEMLKILNEVSEDMEIIQDSWDEYMDTIISESREEELYVHKGELRYPAVIPGLNGLLGATHSSRIKLKILNENAESLLIYQAEPFASIAGLLGKEYPSLLMEEAWKSLLQNHAHDSICGAAVDQAHEDMLYRFSKARTIAEEIAAQSITSIYKNIDLSGFKNSDFTVTIFNSLPRSRKEVISLVIDLPKATSGTGVVELCTGLGANGTQKNIKYFDIIDEKGNKVNYKILSKQDIAIGVESRIDTPALLMRATRRRILVEVDVPAMGYTTYALRPRGPKFVERPEQLPDRPLIAREDGTLENEYMKVTINPNGTFSLYSKVIDKSFENLHYFTDNGEVGNAHFSVNPDRDVVVTSLGNNASRTMVESNTFRGIFRIEMNLSIPRAASLDGNDRLPDMIDIPVSTWLTLKKGSKYLKIKTRLRNTARDHRLRVNFPTGIQTDSAMVESAYAVEKRPVNWTETGDNFERFYEFQPMQNFVDVSDSKVGLAVLNKGLREYEVKDDRERTIAITLLRTHRAYMTANADMIPEEFDKYTGLHSFGEHEYKYALYPHKGDWEEGKVLQMAYQHKVELKALQGVPKKGILPVTNSFFAIEPPDKIMLSALKQAEDKKGYVLRIWNISDDTQLAKVKTSLPITSAILVRLDETLLEKIPIKNGKISFDVGPHKLVSILLKAL